MLGREQRSVLCIFGVVLVCLHTFIVVKTSPTSRKISSDLQRSLKRNLTILAKAFNLTQDSPKRTKLKHHCQKDRLNSGLDRYLVNAAATNTRKVMLYSKNDYLLQIAGDGFVDGTHDDKSLTVWFELQSICVGIVRIKNLATGRYLAMDKHGRLRGRENRSLETLFVTQQVGTYHWYMSYKYKGWFVGIRKDGKRKPGHQTTVHQKAVLFFHVPPSK